MSSIGDFDVDDHQAIAGEQRSELMAAKALDLDLDLAFNLQLQEAMTVSLSLQHLPSTSAAAASSPPQLSPPQPSEGISIFPDVQSDELLKLEQELKDGVIFETELRKMKEDLQLRVHDHSVALEMSRMSDEEWEEWGDNFERPFGEGTSEGSSDEIFRIYFKGLVEIQSDGSTFGGIGVALCDSRDDLLFELRKPVSGNGLNRRITELLALIEGLNAAMNLELKRVAFYCDYYPIFNFVTGKWSSKQRNVAALVNQVSQLQHKFVYCQASIVPRNDIKFAFKFAREAIVSQLSKRDVSKILYETCVICFEDADISEIFSIDNCKHRYCFSCMKQHVEVRLLHGMLPTCPHEGCNTELKIESCRKFLTSRQIEIMSQRSKEASVPVTEKVYCPYPKCSALMSKREVLEFSNSSIIGGETSGERKCVNCNSHFCINCKVPWHKNMTCLDYKGRNLYPQIDESRLKNLAATNMWRQCVKCNHMIELATGCYHMTCRCGYEFCYTCGAEWKNKRATCSCPLWDEENILEEDEEDELEDE